MKNLYILTVLMTVFTINMFAQPPVTDLQNPVPHAGDLPMSEVPPFTVTHQGSGGSSGPSDFRMVYWVHGLNGSAASFNKPASAVMGAQGLEIPDFPPRKVYSFKSDYKVSQDELGSAITTLMLNQLPIEDALPNDYNRRNSFIISHSQGGIVSRWLDRYYSMPENHGSRKFGGVITFATSNQGAEIINNQEDARDIFEDLVKNLAKGPITEKMAAFGAGDLISDLLGDTLFWFPLAEFISENLSDYAISESYPGITQQYQVGAPEIDMLNNYVPDGTELVAFYAIRDLLTEVENISYTVTVPGTNTTPSGFSVTEFLETLGFTIINENIQVNLAKMPVPLSWATIEYFVNDPSGDFEYFKAHEREHHTALKAHILRFKYATKALAYSGTSLENLRRRNAVRPNVFNPTSLALFGLFDTRYRNHKKISDAYNEGVEYLDNFDELHRVFIGAKVSQQIQLPTGNYECKCTISYPYTEEVDIHTINNLQGISCDDIPSQEDIHTYLPIPNANNLSIDCNLHYEYTTQIEWINKPSDGVVLAESAMNIPQATWEPQPVEGSTHMAIRNDENLKYALIDIFEGEVGLFFETEEK